MGSLHGIYGLLQVKGRDPQNHRFCGFASLVKSRKKHLLKQAWQMLLPELDSALFEYYTINHPAIHKNYGRISLKKYKMHSFGKMG